MANQEINSLRIVRLYGGGNGNSPTPSSTFDWFFNGSVKFEANKDVPRIFNSLSEAVQYFTLSTSLTERCRGQVAIYAQNDPENWVSYFYFGPDVSNDNYANPDYWKLFNQGSTPSFIIDEYQEVLRSTDILFETLDSPDEDNEVLINPINP